MADTRLKCLLEARKHGLTLCYDPSASNNRCFYRCMAYFLDISEDEVVEMVESFMILNQLVSCVNEVRNKTVYTESSHSYP
jgi:hypothetical protein